MPAGRIRPSLLAAATCAALVLAACGGPAATTGPGGPGATAAGDGATQGSGGTQNPGGGTATTPPTGGGGTVDACTLLTADDIKAVTGYAVAKARPTAQNIVFPSGCEWELVAKEIVPPSIVLGIMTTGGKAYYDTYFKPYNEEQGNTPIAGLGDEAVDVDFGAVMVLKGENLFNLQYLGEQAYEVELAKKLVTHL